MARPLEIAFFGSSLVSAYWNGAATYYRGILRALHRRGHRITFYEPDAWDRQAHRDIDDPDYARVVVWRERAGAEAALREAAGADLVVKASGVGVLDAFLEEAVLALQRPGCRVAFWDVDAPATLARVRDDASDPFRACIPRYDQVFTYGGGPPVVEGYEAFGARSCVPIYNAHDPDTHHPVAPDPRFGCDLAFLGNRLPDRDERVSRFFFDVARRLPGRQFLLGGSGWDDVARPSNVRWLGHVYTRDHNAFNCTPRAVLNIARDSMADVGWSPATRVFEAAGAGACIITDAWRGIEDFYAPDEEILVAEDADAVVAHLRDLDDGRGAAIGAAARRRTLDDHTYDQRALRVEATLAEGGA
jgi:spore maturation protein CgeB